MSCIRHLFICNALVRELLQPIDPRVANPIAELLFLPPKDLVWQVTLEGLPDWPFLNVPVVLTRHLDPGVDIHCNLKESLVQERHAGLQTEGVRCLIGAETIIRVQSGQLPFELLMELIRIRSLVEVEVAPEDFIRTLSAQNHLHPQGLDLPRQEIHRHAGTNGRHIVCLQVVDHIPHRVDALLHREGELMMDRAQVLGDLPRCLQIRRAVESDAEGMQIVRHHGARASLVLGHKTSELLSQAPLQMADGIDLRHPESRLAPHPRDLEQLLGASVFVLNALASCGQDVEA
mmetsp:Transcript_113210/g.283432  ORF Transcript_113210/g.283432 Transcript_113210/m.283432 type:complete len:290 (-) Transcript_113210:1268-2137(-)